MKTLLYRWAKTQGNLWVNAGSLVGTTAVTSILNFAYWWAAAQWFPPQAIGLGSATISVMKLLGAVCILGLGTLLVRELPRQARKEGSLISAALITAGGIGGCAGIVFAVIAPFVANDFQILRASIENIVLFAFGVSLTTTTFVFDQALIGLLRGDLQFWRNSFFAVAKLVALFMASQWLSRATGMTIYATWAVGNILSLAAFAGFAILKRNEFRSTYHPDWRLLRSLKPIVLQHDILNLALQAPILALPILVTLLLSTTTNAWFYVSWMTAGFLFVMPAIFIAVLYALISGQPVALAYKTRLTVSFALVASIAAACISLLASKQVLSLFGNAYVEQSASSLRILVFGSFPIIIKHHYVAALRIQDRMVRATRSILVGVLFELGLAALGGHLGGLSGLSLGWVAAVWVEAVCMSPTIYRAVRYRTGELESS